MQSWGIITVFVFCSILIAGCMQLPGRHILSDTRDPIIGQWTGGELPASDRYIIFYENHTFLSTNFFLNSGETTEWGNWTKTEPGLYSTQSFKGEIIHWVYNSFDDSIYMRGFPQMGYQRYKG